MPIPAPIGPRPARWAFFPYAHNYGDCSRAIEVAKALRARGEEVRFFLHGGCFADHVARAGFEPVQLAPAVTPRQHEVLMDLDQHRAPIGTPLPFTEAELAAAVEVDAAALRGWGADGVYGALCFSANAAAEVLGLPRVALLPTALCPDFFRQRLASFPDAMARGFVLRRLVPERLKRALINRVMLGDVGRRSAAALNRVRRRHGLQEVHNYPALARGDLTLLADLPELSGLPADRLSPGYRYSGPLFTRLDLPVPVEARRVLARPGPRIYCAMGSSGPPALLAAVVAALRRLPDAAVVCATTSILDPAALGPPSDRFYATRFLPAPEVNALADVAVIHGGQGTVQTAVWAGTPVVGVGLQWEQQANLDGLARAGAGVRVPLHDVAPGRIAAAVRAALQPGVRERARALQRLVRATDGARTAAAMMSAYVRSQPIPDAVVGQGDRRAGVDHLEVAGLERGE